MSIHLKLLLATLFWGATPTIGRVLAPYEAPVLVVCGRFVVASLFLAWFTLAARQFTRVPRRHWWRFAALGVSGIFLHNALLYKGLESTTATTASGYQAVARLGTVGAAVYINLVPIFGILSAALFLGERTSSAVIVGGALVLAGLMLVNRPFRRPLRTAG